MTPRPKVLYIAHNHPEIMIGGAEVFAFELYTAMREIGEFEPILLARTVSPGHGVRHETPFYSHNGDANQVLWRVDGIDDTFTRSSDKEHLTVHFARLLDAYRPDIVHIQHTFGLGFDLIRQIRSSLPDVPILYTLHEYIPICIAEGSLLRRVDGMTRCLRATPARCHECFPEIPPQQIFLRERFVRSQLRLVDLFLAPSQWLLERYVDWGIPRDKLRLQEYGRRQQQPLDRGGVEPPTGHIGFFGQLSPKKGVLVLLQAMRLLAQSGCRDVHLFLNGANLEIQEKGYRRKVSALLEELNHLVTDLGRYDTSEQPERMSNLAWVVIPSIWWENSPLVIQEAFMHRRPVICSNIGAMAEKVQHGVDGLHVSAGNPVALAATLRHAATSPGLWRRLRDGIRPVYTVTDAVRDHCVIYHELLSRASG